MNKLLFIIIYSIVFVTIRYSHNLLPRTKRNSNGLLYLFNNLKHFPNRPNFRRAIKDALNQFKGEGRTYDYVPNRCKEGKSCNNYLQAIWAETEAVGCAGEW